MGTQEEYCLRWNNHQPSIISVFQNLLESQELVDVTLSVETKQIKAHKVILSACSPYFKLLFEETPCKHPVVVLSEIKFVDLKKIIDFIYCGEINVLDEQLADILEVAETLQIKGLFDPNKKDSQNVKQKRKKSSLPKVSQESDELKHLLQKSYPTINPLELEVVPDLQNTSSENNSFFLDNSHSFSELEGMVIENQRQIQMGNSVGVHDGTSKNNSEMVRVKRRYNKSSSHPVNPNLVAAIEAVRTGSIGFCKAAKLYGVNNRTLWLEYKKRGYESKRPPVVSRLKNSLVSQTS